ncbi:AN1 zinc finger protein [Talaromyces proteolyticus]|uniref:AN1 zinc finger protein n=1 Tax=Talaromyces proteolyticus TaxID=1131652 RepID=A0AAD4KL59_9EURO|nr:AN1 zinc finger protein [Talaromyces proteolyticus]KAH8690913.1 AN1 zinc finger protein [Talaromyces proteolyticus]
MADTDLESIGRNCQYEFCGQLDFLPFRCESCRGTYCLEHRTESAHKCSHPGEWAKRKRADNGVNTTSSAKAKATVYNTDQCSHPSCKSLINTPTRLGVHCDKCNRNYCLSHRLGEEHDCAKLVPLGARVGAGTKPGETIRSMFSKLRGMSKDTAPKISAPKIKLPNNIQSRMGGRSAVAQLNEMKRAAKGDAAVPMERRVYLHVVGTVDTPSTKATEPPRGDFFYDARWKVGRVLDDAARRLKVENVNNRGGGEEARLRIFHIEAGEFLEFADSIGGDKSRVKSGHTIVLLRGAGVLLDR